MTDVQVGVVFSQADSGVDADALRDWVRRAEDAGFDHLLAYDHILGASAERLGPGPFGAFDSPAYTNEHTFHEILTLFSHFAAIPQRIEWTEPLVDFDGEFHRLRTGAGRSRSVRVAVSPSARCARRN